MSKTTVEYEVVIETDRSQFVDMVNEKLKRGWALHGDTFTIMKGVGGVPGSVALAHFAQAFMWLENTHE